MWKDGAFSGVGAVLLGLAVSALITTLGLAAQASELRFSRTVNSLLLVTYAPSILVVVNSLPDSVSPNPQSSYVISILSITAGALIHCVVALRRTLKISGARKLAVHQPLKGAVPAYVLTHSTTSQYHKSVAAIEERGTDFRYVQYRISPYFLPSAAVAYVADSRFGTGNPLREAYIDAQARRRKAFFQLIARGACVREIYPRDRLLNYIATGTHAGGLWPLTPELMRDLIIEWRNAILTFPNYMVGIADDSVPMKYHLVDEATVIIHEPIGRGDSHRLNSIFILDQEVGRQFATDFDLVWELIDPKWRDPESLRVWIDNELLPTSQHRVATREATTDADSYSDSHREESDDGRGRNHGRRSRQPSSRRRQT